MKLKIKDYLTVGFLVLIPFMGILWILSMLFGIPNVWNPLLNGLGIPSHYYGYISIPLTFLFAYMVGFIVNSAWIDWILSRIPLFNNIWNTLKSITDRLLFISRGGYKRVIYEVYGYQTKRYQVALVIGRTVFVDSDGAKQDMLVLAQAPPNIFSPLWIPKDETRIIAGHIRDIGLFIASGGFVSPARLDLEHWTDQEYENIPDSNGKGNGKSS